jgi:hypothetical protein
MLYNNKRLKNCDIREDIINYRNSGCIYLRTSLKGGEDEMDRWMKYNGFDMKYAELNRFWVYYCTVRDLTVYEEKIFVEYVDKNLRDSSNWFVGVIHFGREYSFAKENVRTSLRKIFWMALLGQKLHTFKNEKAIFGLVDDRIEFLKTRIIAIDLMYKIEKKILTIYPYMKAENAKQIKICKNEPDILNEKECMETINKLDRWKWQIRGIWKEAKAKNLIISKRISKKDFDDWRIRDVFKDFKLGKGVFKELTDKFKDRNKVSMKKCEHEVFLEYEKYYLTKYRVRLEGLLDDD